MKYRDFIFSFVIATSILMGVNTVVARSLTIERFDADIRVNRDGTISVNETIRPNFRGAWNGIYRNIPVEYRTPQGFNYSLFLKVTSVTDGAGNPLTYERSRERHYLNLKIWIPGAQDAVKTVVIRYSVRNGLRFFEEHDELYWNVTGDEWEAPIAAASAHITLPEEVGDIRATAFTGGYGSREKAASVDIGAGKVTVQTVRELDFREGLTVAAMWNPGVIHRPTFAEKAEMFFRSNWILIIPLIAFGIMFYLWFTRGRDPRRRPVSTRYEPPENLTPAEAGTIIDNYPHMRDITATLVDLAVRGYLRIEERKEEKLLGLISSLEYVLILKKPGGDWTDLKPHEQELLTAIFSGTSGEQVALSDLENKFYKHIPDIRKEIFNQLITKRYYLKNPSKVKKLYLMISVFAGFLIVFSLSFFEYMQTAPLTTIVSGVLTAGFIAAFGYFMPARTTRGTRAMEEVLGFEEFLQRVEADRFERVIKTPELFEKYLPYAMAFKVEKNWAEAFGDIYQKEPAWYSGSSYPGFHTAVFVTSLNNMSGRAGSMMSSSPRSSGGSGFSGGGSGGGFGGGGGGGF